jgi:hypothetical protein
VQLASYADFVMQAAVTAYFVSWCVLAGFVMMNIVLAVLVDSFTSAQVHCFAQQCGASSERASFPSGSVGLRSEIIENRKKDL